MILSGDIESTVTLANCVTFGEKGLILAALRGTYTITVPKAYFTSGSTDGSPRSPSAGSVPRTKLTPILPPPLGVESVHL